MKIKHFCWISDLHLATEGQWFSWSCFHWYTNLYTSNIFDQKSYTNCWCLQIHFTIEVSRRISNSFIGVKSKSRNNLILNIPRTFNVYFVGTFYVLQDFRPSEVYTIEYLIDNTTMGFLVSDSEKNIILYMYQPESRESAGGYFFN